MKYIILVLISLNILDCNGASLKEQLSHIARRFNAFQHGQNSLILGALRIPSHLPEAEPLLPGHTLIRPSLGTLKSAVKFPHRDWENGAGVYGSIKKLGITYGGTNERVLNTGFRNNSNILNIPKSLPKRPLVIFLTRPMSKKKGVPNPNTRFTLRTFSDLPPIQRTESSADRVEHLKDIIKNLKPYKENVSKIARMLKRYWPEERPNRNVMEPTIEGLMQYKKKIFEIVDYLRPYFKLKMENLSNRRSRPDSRRFNAFQHGQNSLILGAPRIPSHLPEAEPLLPGHTLIRPSLGMLKSAVKFPHRDWENGAGVYGSIKKLGITYGGTNERVLYTGFRRNSNIFEISKSLPKRPLIIFLTGSKSKKKGVPNPNTQFILRTFSDLPPIQRIMFDDSIEDLERTIRRLTPYKEKITTLVEWLQPYSTVTTTESDQQEQTIEDLMQYKKKIFEIVDHLRPYIPDRMRNRPLKNDITNKKTGEIRYTEFRRGSVSRQGAADTSESSSEIEIEDLTPPKEKDSDPKLTWFYNSQDSLPGHVQSHKNKLRGSKLERAHA